MKLVVGIILTLVGGIGILFATPYAIIVGMMSGFSEARRLLLACCIAVPISGILICVFGIFLIFRSSKRSGSNGDTDIVSGDGSGGAVSEDRGEELPKFDGSN